MMTATSHEAREALTIARNCIAFFSSAIKSGEPWTEVCEKEREAAYAAIFDGFAALAQPAGDTVALRWVGSLLYRGGEYLGCIANPPSLGAFLIFPARGDDGRQFATEALARAALTAAVKGAGGG